MRPPPNLSLPRRRRRPWIAIAASVAVHAFVFAFGWIEGRVPSLPRRTSQLIVLAPPSEGTEAVEMRFQDGRLPPAIGVPPSDPRPDQVAEVPEPEPERRAEEPADTGRAPPAEPRQPSIGRIGPGLAEGRLWVRPLPLPPKELAERLKKDHAKLVDSAVTAIVQAYLDSIATDPAARNVGLPSWTKEIAGRKFGLDSQNIYIAGLKIPAAVLALLPIPAGNIDQNRAYSHLMDMRTDLQYAAQRSANLQEFKTMIRDMRLRKERQREFERNQRTEPEGEERTVREPEEPLTP